MNNTKYKRVGDSWCQNRNSSPLFSARSLKGGGFRNKTGMADRWFRGKMAYRLSEIQAFGLFFNAGAIIVGPIS